jgi:hypothetical protein
MSQRLLAVDPMRVDAEARVLARKALLCPRQPLAVPHEVHEVGRIAAIEDAERGVEPEPARVLAYQPHADCVERARPWQAQRGWHRRAGTGLDQRLRNGTLRPARHFLRGAAREGQEQQPLRSHAAQQGATRYARERQLGLPPRSPAVVPR